MAARVVAVIGLTAFMGYYAIDLAVTRGSGTVEFAAWAWLATLGWVVLAYAILGIPADLGDRWHAIRPGERSGHIYRRLGVHRAKRFMPNGDYALRLIRRFRPGYRIVTDTESAAAWAAHARSKEAGHALHLGLTVPFAAYLLVQGAWAGLATIVVLDVIFDGYPVFAQRYNRMRIEALLARRRPRGTARP